MLQMAARNTESLEDFAGPAAPALNMKQAAQSLHDALARLERAVAGRNFLPPEHGADLREEARAQVQRMEELEGENARLREENAQSKAAHMQAASQIADISGRLNTLIARVAGLLEE